MRHGALAAANADLPWPGEPRPVLWHAISLLREHRGDGHITALLAVGLDACEALVSFAAIGAAPQEVFASRGWTAAEWSAARDRLAARGWVDSDPCHGPVPVEPHQVIAFQPRLIPDVTGDRG